MSMTEVDVEFFGGPLCGKSIKMMLGDNPEAEIEAKSKRSSCLYVLVKTEERYVFQYQGETPEWRRYMDT